MRLTRAQEMSYLSLLQKHDKAFYAYALSHEEARYAVELSYSLKISRAQMRRLSLYARSSGRVRWWRGGGKKPLPAESQFRGNLLTLMWILNDLERDGVFAPREEAKTFVARYVCDQGSPCSPDDVKRAVACMDDRGPARREGQGSSTRTAVAL